MSRQWSMQAELSISNDNCESKNMPTKENQDGNFVRMVYTITANPTKSASDGGRGNFSDSSASYGFQRGNLTFTSTPPNRVGVQDSGYNSDLQFSSSQNSTRTYVPYERRCKSTCSITLSTDFNNDGSKNSPPTTNFCTHPFYVVENIRSTPDHCEECRRTQSLPPRSSNTYSTHFCTKLPEKHQQPHQWSQFGTKDMMTQTVETKEKCTSPLEKINNPFDDNKSDTELSKFRKKNVRHGYNRKKSSNVVRRHSDLGSNKHSNRNITRSPGILFDKFRDSLKTQTVHIDVYCTASDGDTDSDSTIFNSEEEMDTIFSSDMQKISHRRAKKSELPYSLQTLKNRHQNIPANIFNPELVRNNSYSGDDSSTTYPSALSSYSTLSDFERSFSTTYPNWCDRSISNCTISELNTSIGDMGQRFSLSESESFNQQKYDLQNDSSYVSEKSNITQKSGRFPKTDSFDYADYSDVERIKKMEQLWNESCETKNWKSPETERKHQLQQQKIQEYIQRRLQKTERKLSESSCTSEESENSTVIIYEKEPNTKANLTRGSTIQKSQSKKDFIRVEKRNVDKTSVERSTSSVPEKLSQNTMTNKNYHNEYYTDPFAKAKKFGTVIGARNLGRHIGPAKNPDCLCAHCRSYYSENGNRNRTRSVGNTPFTDTENWRNILKPSDKSKKPFTDY